MVSHMGQIWGHYLALQKSAGVKVGFYQVGGWGGVGGGPVPHIMGFLQGNNSLLKLVFSAQ